MRLFLASNSLPPSLPPYLLSITLPLFIFIYLSIYLSIIHIPPHSIPIYLFIYFLFTIMDLFGFDSLKLKTGSIADDDDDTTLTPYNDCDWSDLHEDLLELILKGIKEEPGTVADCLRFGSVCVSWRSVLVPHFHPNQPHPQLPLLMIPSLPWPPKSPSPSPSSEEEEEEKQEEKEEETRSFYSLSERRIISEEEEDLKIKLPYNMYCRGCSYGWIIATGNEDNGYSVELLNPFISINNKYQKIQLPPLTDLPYDPLVDVFHIDYMEKAILSANPSTTTTGYVVMAIYRISQLCFWKPGNQVWTHIPVEGQICLDDIIYHHSDGLFYLVNGRGEVMVCDLDHEGRGGTVRRFAPAPMLGIGGFSSIGGLKKYMVESLGDLLMLHKYGDNKFKVFKFRGEKKNEEEEEEEEEVMINVPWAPVAEWKFMTTLPPDQMLFVGNNASMSLSARDFIGGKSGCIYFTDDFTYKRDVGFPDIGIFDMKDKTIEKLQPAAGSNDYISPANTIWVAPTLRCRLRF